MTREEEDAVVRRAQEGDTDAFETLVLAHQKKIYNLALRMLGNADDALDISQETFLKAYSFIGSFRGECKFSVWLYRVASNMCVDFLRRKSRRAASSTAYVNDEGEAQELDIPDSRFEPQTELEKSELRRAVRAGLMKLPEDSRRILLLREINGLSYEEIGELLHLESGTVKSRIFRARKRLCGILAEDGNISEPPPSIIAREV